jgi:hypothetical protein
MRGPPDRQQREQGTTTVALMLGQRALPLPGGVEQVDDHVRLEE